MRSLKSSGKLKRRKILFARRVIGKSMQPGLQPGQLVIASGWFQKLAPEAVVVIRHNKLDKVKRIRKIQANRVFVVGDNNKASLDSRSFGWLDKESIIGKVLWPRM